LETEVDTKVDDAEEDIKDDLAVAADDAAGPEEKA